ncbi:MULTISPECIES: hypothetical protein [Paraburkholderia]|uniref:hypothetical protein n=1 Tax=Paraburkholderia TaxID=1822464 RepID=UPI000255350D|nr:MULTISPECIES: hypothetical protein [Paraburkholderia]MDR8399319.1 hypothetical protein [Paraburkholderia sp. USG1]
MERLAAEVAISGNERQQANDKHDSGRGIRASGGEGGGSVSPDESTGQSPAECVSRLFICRN